MAAENLPTTPSPTTRAPPIAIDDTKQDDSDEEPVYVSGTVGGTQSRARTRVTFAHSSSSRPLSPQLRTDTSQESRMTRPKKVTLQNSQKIVPRTYLFGTNESTKKGKAILISISLILIAAGLYALIVAGMNSSPDLCKKEPTVKLWLQGEGTMYLIVGIATLARLKFLGNQISETATFLKWLLFILYALWLSCATGTLLFLAITEELFAIDCHEFLLQSFVWFTGSNWVGLVMFAALTAMKHRQANMVRFYSTHEVLVRNTVFADFLNRN